MRYLILLLLLTGCKTVEPIQSHTPPAGLIKLCLFDERFAKTEMCAEAVEKFNAK